MRQKDGKHQDKIFSRKNSRVKQKEATTSYMLPVRLPSTLDVKTTERDPPWKPAQYQPLHANGPRVGGHEVTHRKYLSWVLDNAVRARLGPTNAATSQAINFYISVKNYVPT